MSGPTLKAVQHPVVAEITFTRNSLPALIVKSNGTDSVMTRPSTRLLEILERELRESFYTDDGSIVKEALSLIRRARKRRSQPIINCKQECPH